MSRDPTTKLARLRSELVELVRRRDLVRSHGIATHALDRQIDAKQTLELLEQVAEDLAKMRRR